MSPVACAYGNSGSPVPVAPATVAVVTVSATSVTIDWTSVSSATSYNIKRSLITGGPYTTIASGVTDTEYEDTGLDSGVEYFYVVSASNSGGEGPDSDQVDATTLSDSPSNYPNLIRWADGSQYNGTTWPGYVVGFDETNYTAPVSNIQPAANAGPPPSVDWSGSNFNDGDKLTFGGDQIIANANPYTVILIGTCTGDSNIIGSNAFNSQIRAMRSGANVLSAYDNNSEAISSAFSNPASAMRMMVWQRSGGETRFYEGFTARGSTLNAGGFTMRFDVIGVNSFTGGCSNGKWYEICVYTGALSQANLQSLAENYFLVKYPTLAL